jgi:hypothetical protein
LVLYGGTCGPTIQWETTARNCCDNSDLAAISRKEARGELVSVLDSALAGEDCHRR